MKKKVHRKSKHHFKLLGFITVARTILRNILCTIDVNFIDASQMKEIKGRKKKKAEICHLKTLFNLYQSGMDRQIKTGPGKINLSGPCQKKSIFFI